MQDERIVSLYFKRDENAIRETEKKYGRYLTKIAHNILVDLEDCKECVNTTYFKAWTSIPPHKPSALAAYLGKITRECAIEVFRTQHRKKRSGSEYELSLSELDECIPTKESTESQVEFALLTEALNTFLYSLTSEERCVFVGRYYYMDSIKNISFYYGMSETKVKSMLFRMRNRLKNYLEKEGFCI